MGKVLVSTLFFDSRRQAGYYPMFASAAVDSRPGCDARVRECALYAASGTEKTVKASRGATRTGRFAAFDLAARGESLAGQIDAARRDRLVDRLAPAQEGAPIAWKIVGGRDPVGRPMLTVSVEGSVPLVCQRCLQPFDLPIAQQTELLLAREEAELEPLDAGEAEVVLAAEPLDALTLIEDEILLSLPFVPHHAEGQCPGAVGTTAAPAGDRVAPGTSSPFARLAALKKRTDRSTKE
jgi:uncharacterized protein